MRLPPPKPTSRTIEYSNSNLLLYSVVLAMGKHPFSFRTRQLSPSAPMVADSDTSARVGHRRFILKPPERVVFLLAKYQ